MSSVLDALTPEQRAILAEEIQYGRLERALIHDGMGDLLRRRLVTYNFAPTPSAGQESVIRVPAGVFWELLSWHGVLTTSATVANRFVSLTITDQDGNIYVAITANSTITASQAIRQTFVAGIGAWTTGGTATAPLPSPPIAIPANHLIRTSTSNEDATDAWTQIRLAVREWTPAAIAHAARYLVADLDSAGGI